MREIGAVGAERVRPAHAVDADDELEASLAGSVHAGGARLERGRVAWLDSQLSARSQSRVGCREHAQSLGQMRVPVDALLDQLGNPARSRIVSVLALAETTAQCTPAERAISR